MAPTNQKVIKLCVTNISLQGKKHASVAYVYRGVETSFEKSFTVSIENLHDYLFGNITILVKDGQRTLSGTKLPIKGLKSMKYVKIPLVTPQNINSADFLNKPYSVVGFASFSLSIEDTPQKFKESKQKLPNVLLNTVFNRFMSDFVARIFNLAFVIQGGTLRCKIRAILGFMVTQLLGSQIFHSCDGSHEEAECQDEDCFKKYGSISAKNAKQGLKALHYSAIAYSHAAFPIFAPKRLREVLNNDPVKAYILEHAIINETDILKSYAGTLSSSAFTAFFDHSRLIVAFRGTCTPNELLNALDARYVPFLDGFAHSGLLRLARRFLEDEWLLIRRAMKKRKCKSVLFTGHSLGGAVATMVYLILKGRGDSMNGTKLAEFIRSDIRRVQARVLVFSAPPCVSRSIASKSYPDILAFNYERDTIPQLSFGSILDLKYLCLSISIKKALLCMFLQQRSQIIAEINQVREFLRSSNTHEKLFSPGTLYHIRTGLVKGKVVCRYRIVRPEFYGEIKHYINSLFNHIMIRVAHAFNHMTK